MGIIEPICTAFGWVMDKLFIGLSAIGLGKVAIAIILFTLIVKVLMFPLTIKQQKLTKFNSIMAPELRAVQDKYKERGNQEAMQAMQAETKAVYEKYGVSQFGGCVQLLIQMPILYALYGVFRNIPTYIESIKAYFTAFVGTADGTSGIFHTDGFADIMANNFTVTGVQTDWTDINTTINAINSFTADQWDKLRELFPSFADTITTSQDSINHVNTIFGVSMSVSPSTVWGWAIIIPILAAVTQFISVKISNGNTASDDNPASSSMKMMIYIMPLVSGFFALSLPAGLGLYWIATAVIQSIFQLLVNLYYDKIGVETIIARSAEKAKKKREKKGVKAETLQKNASMSTRNAGSNERLATLKAKQEANNKRLQELKEQAKEAASSGKSADNTSDKKNTSKSGSLASKVNLVTEYNNKNDKKK